MVFYRSKNDVILTQGFNGWLPVKYFIKAQLMGVWLFDPWAAVSFNRVSLLGRR